jgi:hypothetical protein
MEKRLFSIEKVEQIGIPSSISKEKRSHLLYGLGLLHMNLRGEDSFTDAIEKFNLSIQENLQIPSTNVALVLIIISFLSGTSIISAAAVSSNFSTSTPIKHLVIIVQENVSFDHYFAQHDY